MIAPSADYLMGLTVGLITGLSFGIILWDMLQSRLRKRRQRRAEARRAQGLKEYHEGIELAKAMREADPNPTPIRLGRVKIEKRDDA